MSYKLLIKDSYLKKLSRY